MRIRLMNAAMAVTVSSGALAAEVASQKRKWNAAVARKTSTAKWRVAKTRPKRVKRLAMKAMIWKA